MSETLKILLTIFAVVGAMIFALGIAGWKMKKARDFIIRDLKEKKALDPASAVGLSYAKSPLINIGLRDYRPQALKELVKHGMVGILEGEQYYLRGEHKLSGKGNGAAE